MRQFQGNFSKGMVSPEMEARFDMSAYQAGVRQATNFRIRRTGGMSKRMGTRMVAEALSATARLIPFQFSNTQAYALEFGQAYMRPLALGGAVLTPTNGLVVTGITKAINAVVTVANHGLSAGGQVYFAAIAGMTEINDRFLTITATTANTLTLAYDSRNAGTFSGSGGGDTLTVPPGAPPPAPPVPPPVVPPTPPSVGGNGGGGYGTFSGLGNENWINSPHPNIP